MVCCGTGYCATVCDVPVRLSIGGAAGTDPCGVDCCTADERSGPKLLTVQTFVDDD